MQDGQTTRRVVKLAHDNGLHLRPIQLLVRTMSEFGADVNIRFDDKTANAKSLLDLMSLGATFGADLNVEASGTDAEAALEAVVKVLGTAPDS